MGDFFRSCRDGHRCENGSQCAEDPKNEGSYFCDCSTGSGGFAGLYCEFEADEPCSFPQEVSETWFCYNRGTCVVDVSSSSSNIGCDCPNEYEGQVRSFLLILRFCFQCCMYRFLLKEYYLSYYTAVL
jgi:hypothetical protein